MVGEIIISLPCISIHATYQFVMYYIDFLTMYHILNTQPLLQPLFNIKGKSNVSGSIFAEEKG